MALPVYQQQDTVFQPVTRQITAIKQFIGMTGILELVITTSVPHQYKNGIIVTFKIPTGWEPQAINGLSGTVFSIDSDDKFTLSIAGVNEYFEPFAAAPLYPESAQIAQVVPAGEINETTQNAFRNALPY